MCDLSGLSADNANPDLRTPKLGSTAGNRAEEQFVVVNSADNANPDFRTPKLGSELQEAMRVYDFEESVM
ncbi:hypothetical protein K435DRAFT_875477 [Dendrothele bispora CBS 962.96]|uniref:Uncharacterized protein n=1 Tax=Dendrothele bispora (strain CBS 962.96) TaxID=1314807 RepID=A0A4S8KU67_DENBC|nr:hypothetical protein K435DRAFT_875477 [Dendrothele bispora CBS 962.96]